VSAASASRSLFKKRESHDTAKRRVGGPMAPRGGRVPLAGKKGKGGGRTGIVKRIRGIDVFDIAIAETGEKKSWSQPTFIWHQSSGGGRRPGGFKVRKRKLRERNVEKEKRKEHGTADHSSSLLS